LSADKAPHRSAVHRAFTQQAASFENPRLNTAFTSGLDRLVASATPAPTDICLDVAAGTGHLARSFAPHVRQVTAIDTTRAMLEEGKRQADIAGLTNVVFCRGDVEDLPFVSSSFSLVMCRFGLHHFADPTPCLREMARVCRPAGRLLLADMIASGDPATAQSQDRLERLRDPSHASMVTISALTDLLTTLGVTVMTTDVEEVVRPVDTWLAQAGTDDDDAAAIEAEFVRELEGGHPTGMRPKTIDGRLFFYQQWLTLVGAASQLD